MAMGKRSKVPADLARVRDRFVAWRKSREPGSRIPQGLWSEAARLAGSHGLHRTASVLKLDYNALKRHVTRAGRDRESVPAAFVEVTPSAFPASSQCVLEVEDVSGARMRVSLSGYAAADVVWLARAVWSGE